MPVPRASISLKQFENAIARATDDALAYANNPPQNSPTVMQGPIADAILDPVAEKVAELVTKFGADGVKLLFRFLASRIPF